LRQTGRTAEIAGGRSGQQDRKRRNNVALGKVDWQSNANNSFTASYNWHRWNAPNTVQAQQVVSRGLTDNGTDIVKTDSVVGKWTSIIGTKMVNELKFQFGRDFESQVPNSADPRTTITSGISFGMSEFLPRPAWPNEKRLQWVDTLSYQMGSHSLKFGADINYVRNTTINHSMEAAFCLFETQLFGLAQDAVRHRRELPGAFLSPSIRILSANIGRLTQAFDAAVGDRFMTTTDYNFFATDTFKLRPTVT
jgi:hypothetical protein